MRIPALLISVSLALLPAGVSAAVTEKEPSRYDIEVLVFENLLPELVGDELLNSDTATPRRRLPEAIANPEPSANEGYLRPVVADLLQRDGHYRVIGYAHWQQTFEAVPKTPVPSVRVAALDPARAGELEGAVRLNLTRFLHLDVVLQFREVAATAAAPVVYQINEQRRIRSQETSYFDHPRFGALVRVMPLEDSKQP